jgi:hypothetical protein
MLASILRQSLIDAGRLGCGRKQISGKWPPPLAIENQQRRMRARRYTFANPDPSPIHFDLTEIISMKKLLILAAVAAVSVAACEKKVEEAPVEAPAAAPAAVPPPVEAPPAMPADMAPPADAAAPAPAPTAPPAGQ